MRTIVQDSVDGSTWRDFYLLGEPLVFSSKKAAKVWFEDLIETNNPDWRVGFLVRFRDGKFFRLVDRNGKQVNP